MMKQLVPWLAAFLLTAPLSTLGGDAERIESRLTFVERLVNQSSLARKIAASGSTSAMDLREQSLRALARARDEFEQRNLESAKRSLHEATTLMFEAEARLDDAADAKIRQRTEVDALKLSLETMLEAHERITGGSEEHQNIKRDTNVAVKEADAELEAGRPEDARRVLRSAYHQIKLAIERGRSGQTLVNTLSFDTPDAEYHYELDRNETHLMLMTVLLVERVHAPGIEQYIADQKRKAKGLRDQAELQAGQGHYERAVALLEASTRELVVAIRRAGIYIPG